MFGTQMYGIEGYGVMIINLPTLEDSAIATDSVELDILIHKEITLSETRTEGAFHLFGTAMFGVPLDDQEVAGVLSRDDLQPVEVALPDLEDSGIGTDQIDELLSTILLTDSSTAFDEIDEVFADVYLTVEAVATDSVSAVLFKVKLKTSLTTEGYLLGNRKNTGSLKGRFRR